MAQLKLTKNALRSEQTRLAQLSRYLPTLQLKKAMLQSEVGAARQELHAAQDKLHRVAAGLKESVALLSQPTSFTWEEVAVVERVEKRRENIAGVEIDVLEGVFFAPFRPPSLGAPLWAHALAKQVRFVEETRLEVQFLQGALEALQRELREVSIRVNLFEKILIPRARAAIKKIRIFLQDQELAAVGRAKVAKSKHRRPDEDAVMSGVGLTPMEGA